MDTKQEEMMLLGLFGMYRESYKTILRCRKIFSQITQILILPLYFFFLAQILLSEFLYESSTVCTDHIIKHGADPYMMLPNISYSGFKTNNLVFKAGSIIYLLAASSLSTSAGVYATACILSGRKVSFSKATGAFLKVWKKLLLNFICSNIAYLAYQVIAVIAIVGWEILVKPRAAATDHVLVIGALPLPGLHSVGKVYMGIVWQLADVVSVLENIGGFKAMKKSKELIKGKLWMATLVYFNFDFTFHVGKSVFRKMFVQEYYWNFGKIERIGYGIICLLLLTVLCLFGGVLGTVFYFVCKSCHNETIQMSAALADDQLADDYHQLPSKALALLITSFNYACDILFLRIICLQYYWGS